MNTVVMKAAPGSVPHVPRKGTKTYKILKGMTRKRGLTIDDIEHITGWERASAFSAISDDMRKRCGMTVRKTGDRYTIKLPAHVSL